MEDRSEDSINFAGTNRHIKMPERGRQGTAAVCPLFLMLRELYWILSSHLTPLLEQYNSFTHETFKKSTGRRLQASSPLLGL